MKQNDPETNLHSLSKTDLFLVLWYVRLRWLRYKVSLLRPQQLIIPATLLQITAFIITAYFSHNIIPVIAVANFVIVGIAFIPSTIPRPIKAHWVKAYEQ